MLRGLLSEPDLARLRNEAFEMEPGAHRSMSPGDGGAMWRGGNPARAYRTAGGGHVQYGLFANPLLAGAISDVVGFGVELTGAGSYSYYDCAGDFLGLHRDVVGCDVALLTCLESGGGPGGGCLRTYPEFVEQSLAAIAHHACPPYVDVPLGPDDTAVLLGGHVPHEVTPMTAGQRRIVSILCFRAVG